MPSIGMVGFMVGDDIHLVMWESVGDVIIAGDIRVGCVMVFAIVVLCHTNRELFCLGHYELLMHTCPHLAKECILPLLLAVPCDILENIWEHEIVERRSTKILVIFTIFYQKCTIVNIRLD
jgi:hypothetical protein